jgi:rhodanese-related sulfurtransferase
MQILKNLFGLGPKVDFKELLRNGAQIIDVRTEAEFRNGHIKGALNIPLNKLSAHCSKLKKDKPIITCCASGIRSASAKSMLQANGFSQVYNGGGWTTLQKNLK